MASCWHNAGSFHAVCWVFLKLRIDDPLSAAPMHGFGGMWGVFFTGLLAKQEYIQEAYGRSDHYGAFYRHSTGKLIASQVVHGTIAIHMVAGSDTLSR
jgi:ammonium transporter, Amt family